MKNVYIFLILLCSCGNANVNSPKVAQEQQPLNEGKNSSCVFKVINNDIVKHIFTIDVFRSDTTSLKTIFKTQPNIKVLKEKGIYDDNEYLNYVFETPNAYVKLFKNNEGFYIERALIKEDEIKLYKNSAIGMLKNDFCKQFSIEETSCDTIEIIDEDQTLSLKFIFNKKHLKQLEIKASE